MKTLAGPARDSQSEPSQSGSSQDEPVLTAPSAAAKIRTTVGAYVALTKPRIIELLLVTTVPTMILAERGLPSIGLVLATLLGGSLAAGSANALNCYVDRDIDQLMRRTARRPWSSRNNSARRSPV